MSAIKVGDRAEVVKWPCCGKFLGAIVMVTGFYDGSHLLGLRCAHCRKVHQILSGKMAEDHTLPEGTGLLCCCPIEYLRKLPSLAEPETIETHDEATV